MPDTPRRKLMNGEHWRQSSVSAALSSATTTAALIAYLTFSPQMNDRLHSGDADRLEDTIRADFRRDINRIESRQDRQDRRLEQILLAMQALDRRVDGLPPDEWQDRIEALEIWIIKQDNTYDVPR